MSQRQIRVFAIVLVSILLLGVVAGLMAPLLASAAG